MKACFQNDPLEVSLLQRAFCKHMFGLVLSHVSSSQSLARSQLGGLSQPNEVSTEVPNDRHTYGCVNFSGTPNKKSTELGPRLVADVLAELFPRFAEFPQNFDVLGHGEHFRTPNARENK